MKNKRHAAILDIISKTNTVTQTELTQKLKEEGFSVTQATVSRDIKELGLVKTAAAEGGYKYQMPGIPGGASAKHMNIFSQSVLSVEYALHTIVIKTLPGMAQAAGAAIDNSVGKEILGSIAGDDSIIIVTQSAEHAAKLSKKLNNMRFGNLA